MATHEESTESLVRRALDAHAPDAIAHFDALAYSRLAGLRARALEGSARRLALSAACWQTEGHSDEALSHASRSLDGRP